MHGPPDCARGAAAPPRWTLVVDHLDDLPVGVVGQRGRGDGWRAAGGRDARRARRNPVLALGVGGDAVVRGIVGVNGGPRQREGRFGTPQGGGGAHVGEQTLGRARLVGGTPEAHDQVVAGSGHCDVEQPGDLRFLRGARVVAELRVTGRLQAVPSEAVFGAVRSPQQVRRTQLLDHAEPGEDGDRELEAFGAVHGEDADRVVVVLGNGDFDDARFLLDLLAQPGDKRTQAVAATVDECPRRLADEAQTPPVVAWPGQRHRQLEQAPLADNPLDGLAHRLPPPAVVELAQRRQTGDHRMAGGQVRRCRAVVPAAAGQRVLREAIVATAEAGRPERGDDRDLVGRVVDRGEDGQQLLHLGGREHQRLALEPRRDAGVFERVLEERQGLPGRQEDGDVGETRGPGARAVVLGVDTDRPLLVDRAPDEAGNLLRLGAAQRGEVVGGHGVAEHDDGDRRRGARRAHGVERGELGLQHAVAEHQITEHRVREGQDPRPRTVVLRERDPVAERVADLVVQRDVGAAKPVDRLLGVAHHEQPPVRYTERRRGPAGDVVVIGDNQRRNLDLQRIGVLELVDEHDLVAIVQRAPDGAVTAQDIACEDEEVVELEPAFGPAFRNRRAHEVERRAKQAAYRRAQDAFDGRLRRPLGVREERLHLRLALAHPRVALALAEREPRPAPQQLECFELVAGGREPVAVHRERVEMREQQVARDPTVAASRQDRVECEDHRSGVGRRHRLGSDLVRAQPVPVGVHQADETLDLAHPETDGGQHDDRPLQRGVGEARVDEAAPAVVEGEARLDVVEHFERGRQSGFERELGEQPLREAVQRGDRRLVERRDRGPAPLAPQLVVGGGRLAFELRADALAELGRGRLRKGDRGNAANVDAAGEEIDGTGDERPGLARTGAGFDEQRAVERALDDVAGVLVEQRRHGSTPTSL